ncbi:MAG: GNAT family N-acetyltransferase [Paludibacteraceae bacterium]|nr:GNAT family N-acetyltransferase [Paludibacteraceae bacterium]
MTNKELYAEFCKTQENMPVFMQAWWMDAVCAGKEWDVMLFDEDMVTGDKLQGAGHVNDEEDAAVPNKQVSVKDIAAAMPYLIRKRFGIRYVLMPQQTQIGGVWIREDKREDEEFLKRLADNIVERLKELKLWYYYQQYPIDSPLPQLLKERGLKVKERVTYRIDDLSNLDEVMGRFSKNKRRQLQKALTLNADTDMNVEDFYRYHVQCLEEQGKKITYTREFLMVLYLKAARHGQCKIMRIKTADGETAAAAFLVRDKTTLYYLIPCYSPRFKDSGAGALLVWEAIKTARQQGVQFDFEGSMIRGVANHYKQFGSVPHKYCSVRKYYHPIFALALLFNRMRS